MSKYSCKCPSPGCVSELMVVANSRPDAFKKLFEVGNRHFIDNHPDFPESAIEDAFNNMDKKMKVV